MLVVLWHQNYMYMYISKHVKVDGFASLWRFAICMKVQFRSGQNVTILAITVIACALKVQ